MSANNTCPAAAAAVHNPKIEASEWRTPRRSRGSSIAAKHSRSPPAPARASTRADAATSATAGCASARAGGAGAGTTGAAADATGMTDCTRNGATDRDQDLQQALLLRRLRCLRPADTPIATQP
jgi:hypothetical protein